MTSLPATPTVGTLPGLDWHDLRRAQAYGRKLQALAMASFLCRIGRRLVSAVRELWRRRADRFALVHMSDHMLADIGLRRMDVQGIAYGVIPIEHVRAQPAPTPRSAEVAILRPRTRRSGPDRELDAAA